MKRFPSDTVTNFLAEHEGYVAWSGGKDSTVVMLETVAEHPDVPVVWFHSGLEFPETEQYMFTLASQRNLNFHVIDAPVDALTVLAESGVWRHDPDCDGLPPQAGDALHHHLVEVPSLLAHAKFGKGELLGLRAAESKGRRIQLSKYRGRWNAAGGREVYCPLWDWSDSDVARWYAESGISMNPVYEKFSSLGVPAKDQRAGMILDGNGLVWGGRGAVLRAGWPEIWHRLRRTLPRLEEWR